MNKEQELTEEFLTQISGIATYWANHGKTIEATAEGIAFSILSMLDGEHEGPKYELISNGTPLISAAFHEEWAGIQQQQLVGDVKKINLPAIVFEKGNIPINKAISNLMKKRGVTEFKIINTTEEDSLIYTLISYGE